MYGKIVKPLLDRLLAVVLLIIFFPMLMIVSLFVYFMMGRPIFFRQERAGYKGEIFKIYKFRTMSNAVNDTGTLLCDDARMTKVGKFLRNMSLDELPQLFNIIKGEMSFVGPRPLLVEYLPLYSKEQKKRHDVKPGITGWAQVNGRNAITWEDKFVLDVWYVEHMCFMLDIKIMWLTLWKVLHRSDISSQNTVTMEKFEGN
jgi:lipopolysaccharide/colanic/teichoic acid biosynthesis glycosyltransferase